MGIVRASEASKKLPYKKSASAIRRSERRYAEQQGTTTFRTTPAEAKQVVTQAGLQKAAAEQQSTFRTTPTEARAAVLGAVARGEITPQQRVEVLGTHEIRTLDVPRDEEVEKLSVAEAKKTDTYRQAVLADKEYLSRALGIPASAVTTEMVENLGAASYSKRALTYLVEGQLPSKTIGAKGQVVSTKPAKDLVTPTGTAAGFVQVSLPEGGYAKYFSGIATQKQEFEEVTGKEFSLEEYIELARTQTPVEVEGKTTTRQAAPPFELGYGYTGEVLERPGITAVGAAEYKVPRVAGMTAEQAVRAANVAAQIGATEYRLSPKEAPLEVLRPGVDRTLDVFVPGGAIRERGLAQQKQQVATYLIEKYPEKLGTSGIDVSEVDVPFFDITVKPYLGMTKGEALALVAGEYGLSAQQVESLPQHLITMKALEIEANVQVEQLQEKAIKEEGIIGEFKAASTDILVFYPAKITTTAGIAFGTEVSAVKSVALGEDYQAEAKFFQEQFTKDVVPAAITATAIFGGSLVAGKGLKFAGVSPAVIATTIGGVTYGTVRGFERYAKGGTPEEIAQAFGVGAVVGGTYSGVSYIMSAPKANVPKKGMSQAEKAKYLETLKAERKLARTRALSEYRDKPVVDFRRVSQKVKEVRILTIKPWRLVTGALEESATVESTYFPGSPLKQLQAQSFVVRQAALPIQAAGISTPKALATTSSIVSQYVATQPALTSMQLTKQVITPVRTTPQAIQAIKAQTLTVPAQMTAQQQVQATKITQATISRQTVIQRQIQPQRTLITTKTIQQQIQRTRQRQIQRQKQKQPIRPIIPYWGLNNFGKATKEAKSLFKFPKKKYAPTVRALLIGQKTKKKPKKGKVYTGYEDRPIFVGQKKLKKRLKF